MSIIIEKCSNFPRKLHKKLVYVIETTAVDNQNQQTPYVICHNIMKVREQKQDYNKKAELSIYDHTLHTRFCT
jgi:hypothetical protein